MLAKASDLHSLRLQFTYRRHLSWSDSWPYAPVTNEQPRGLGALAVGISPALVHTSSQFQRQYEMIAPLVIPCFFVQTLRSPSITYRTLLRGVSIHQCALPETVLSYVGSRCQWMEEKRRRKGMRCAHSHRSCRTISSKRQWSHNHCFINDLVTRTQRFVLFVSGPDLSPEILTQRVLQFSLSSTCASVIQLS